MADIEQASAKHPRLSFAISLSALATGVVTTLSVAVGLVTGLLHLGDGSGSTASGGTTTATVTVTVAPPSLVPSIHIETPEGGQIPFPSDVTGSVAGLGPGQTVWLFGQLQSPDAPTQYPNVGPCLVENGTKWSCSLTVFDTRSKGGFVIWATVLSDTQVLTILSKRDRCLGTPGVARANCDVGIQATEPPHVGEAIDKVAVTH